MNRVAIIGLGELASESAYTLIASPEIRELVLVGAVAPGFEEEVGKVTGSLNMSRASLRFGSMADAATADVVVIGAESSTEGELDIHDEIERVREIVRELGDLKFSGVLLVTVEPVEEMLRAAADGPLALVNVIGIGSSSSSQDPRAIGRSTWCTGLSSDVAFADLCDPECPHFPRVEEKLRMRREDPSVSPVGPGDVAICVTRICKAIVSPFQSIIPVWTIGDKGVRPSAPCIVGKGKVSPILDLKTHASAARPVKEAV